MTIRAVAHAATLWVLWHYLPPTAPWELRAWRVYESRSLHIGVRPAFDLGNGFGLTLQVSVMTPW
jgi:hypothetical protein